MIILTAIAATVVAVLFIVQMVLWSKVTTPAAVNLALSIVTLLMINPSFILAKMTFGTKVRGGCNGHCLWGHLFIYGTISSSPCPPSSTFSWPSSI